MSKNMSFVALLSMSWNQIDDLQEAVETAATADKADGCF